MINLNNNQVKVINKNPEYRNYNTILTHLDYELNNILNKIKDVDGAPTQTMKINGALDLLDVIKNFAVNWHNYCKTYDGIMETIKEKYKNIEKQNKALNEEKHSIELENAKLQTQVKLLTETVDFYNKEFMETLEKSSELLEHFDDENIKEKVDAIVFTQKIKNTNRGSENPRYRTDIDNDELLKDYEINNKINKEMLEKYGMTYQGLKLRLIKLGVWKGRK